MITPPRVPNAPKILFVTPTRLFKRALTHELLQHDNTLILKQASPLCDAVEWSSAGEIGILGPLIGAPALVLACEAFIHSGTKAIALMGAIGGISSTAVKIDHGQVIFPREVLSMEGTSPLYGAPRSWTTPAHSLQEQLEHVFSSASLGDVPVRSTSGMICSTDAPMMENEEAIEQMRRQGVSAVDMEFAALHYLCMLREIPLAAGFIVSDVFEQSWIPGFSRLKNNPTVSILCSSFVGTMLAKQDLTDVAKIRMRKAEPR